MDNLKNLMMKQTRKELIVIAKAENVPYTGLNKNTLIDRIQHYRDTVGTLYRKNKSSLKALAKAENIRGYGGLSRSKLIDTILYHRRVVQPQIKDLSKLKKSELVKLAKKEGLKVIGGRKARIAQNIAANRIGLMQRIVEDVANSEVVELALSKRFRPEEIEGAFDGGYVRFRSKGVEEHQGVVSVKEYIRRTRHHVLKVLEEMIRRGESWKVQLNLAALFRKVDGSDEYTTQMWSTPHVIMEGTDIEELLDEMRVSLMRQYEKILNTMEASDYVFVRVVEMTYHCHRVDLNRGGSYIELPDWVKNKKCCINPKNNDDNECFKWAVISALHHEDIGVHPERISKLKPYIDRYDWSGIDFPTPSTQWKKFEKQNPNVALNVLVIEAEKEIRQGYISKYNTERSKCADVLIVGVGKRRHYVAIKSLPALLRGVTSNHHGDFYCRNCFGCFRSKDTLDLHIQACKDHDFCYVKMPEEGKDILRYQEGSKSIRVPFIIYADTECIIRPIHSVENRSDKSSTRNVAEHVGCGAAMLIKFAHGEYKRTFEQCRGEDAISTFCKTLKRQVERAVRYKKREMNPLTPEEKQQYREAGKCHLCRKSFQVSESVGDRKVRDHCHYTGKFRGAAHSSCNLAHRIPKHIPVVFHNLSGYDAHVIIRELAQQFDVSEMEVLAENTEKYISFSVPIFVGLSDKDGNPVMYEDKKTKEMKQKTTKCMLRFIDSCRFMKAGLGSLVDNLVGTNTDGWKCCEGEDLELIEIDCEYVARFECEKCCKVKTRQLDQGELEKRFINLRSRCLSDEHFRLFLRKGVYPYEYMDSFDRFEETVIPPKEAFYSNLNLSDISDRDYQHALKVFKALECRDLGDFHDWYLCSDVLLLADVFENFRDTCQSKYGLDPAHFYSAPGLSWAAALKHTNVVLQLLTDKDMLLMFEKGIRGGMCQAINHYARANNKYMGERYDENVESSHIMYLDANNLYGCSMSRKLPTSGFKWVEDPASIDILGYSDGDIGYVLEVDVEYPKTLHKLHNELPFLPEKMRLGKVEKLVCSLYDKEKYIVHIDTLKQAMEHGLMLKKVHRAISFQQSAWLKPYIGFNTQERKKAKNDFEKNFYKLMNNSVFGKTMENVREHKNIKLVNSEKKRKMYASKVNYKNTVRFTDKFMAMNMRRNKVVMNKPVYLGFAILDLSKTVMYEFHYDYIKPKYGGASKLMYMDTDSLVYHIKTDDFYKDIAGDVEARFDTSNYPKPKDESDVKYRPLPIGKNNKIIGRMKDELGGKIMAEFIALRPKMYAYEKLDGGVDKKCKGTKKCVVKKHITFKDYKKVLETGDVQYRTQQRFISDKHRVFTQSVRKVALSANDDKRIQDGNRTWAYGTSLGLIIKDELEVKAWHP